MGSHGEQLSTSLKVVMALMVENAITVFECIFLATLENLNWSSFQNWLKINN